LLSECHTAGMGSMRMVLWGLEGIGPVMYGRLLDGLRKRLGFKSRAELRIEARMRRSGGGLDAYPICAHPECGQMPVDPYTGAPKAIVPVRRWWCGSHVHHAAVGDLDEVGLSLKLSPSGAIVEHSSLEDEKERLEAKARERRHQAEIERRKVEVEAEERAKQARDAAFKRKLPGGFR
jgi:hypothetical protein